MKPELLTDDACIALMKDCHNGVMYPQDNYHGPRAMKLNEARAIEAARDAQWEDMLKQEPDLVQHMVNRFLAWQLPRDFYPDNGIKFMLPRHEGFDLPNGWPTGTNLLHAGQAKAMFEHCLEGAAPQPAQQEPCPNGDCKNKSQCWEPCGELGNSAEHAQPAQRTGDCKLCGHCAATGESIKPAQQDSDKVICPSCCHQFRAIPVNVQQLMLDAGFEPPFTQPAQQERTCSTCRYNSNDDRCFGCYHNHGWEPK